VTVSYRSVTGKAAENYYQRCFAPAIATPVSTGLLDAAALQPGEHVLDVACGTGVIARLAAERVGSTGSARPHVPSSSLSVSPQNASKAPGSQGSAVMWVTRWPSSRQSRTMSISSDAVACRPVAR
jgi:predicted methyltransferase